MFENEEDVHKFRKKECTKRTNNKKKYIEFTISNSNEN